MRQFSLLRLSYGNEATLGLIQDEDQNKVCVTLELPWRHNAHDVSCIPPGDYKTFRRMSPKHGYELFQVKDVPGRDNIEMHIGNFPKDTDGCILLGTSYGGPATILRSQDAFSAFMTLLKDVDVFGLTVSGPPLPEVIAE